MQSRYSDHDHRHPIINKHYISLNALYIIQILAYRCGSLGASAPPARARGEACSDTAAAAAAAERHEVLGA